MLAIGIDIGGTITKIGIVTAKDGCLIKREFSTKKYTSVKHYFTRLVLEIQFLLNHFPDHPVFGIGIGAPGVDDHTGRIVASENIKWLLGFDLANHLSDYFETKARLINDANACALGENKFGAARGLKNVIFITLGTGLGGALIFNGKLILGRNGMAGEIGHINVKPDGRSCNCGKLGCLETYVSATGIKRTVFKLLADYNKESILRESKFNGLEARDVTQAALQNDPVAVEAFRYTGDILGYKLADLVAVLDPEAIIISGGLSKAGDVLFDPIRNSLDKSMLSIYERKVVVMPSTFDGATAAILGAASQFLTTMPKL